MIMDLYELTMANGVWNSDMRDTVTYFDMFFRRVPDKGGYAIMAGLEQLIEYMNDLHFDADDIEYLKSLNLFCDEFIDVYLATELTPTAQSLDENEFVEIEEYTLSELLDKIFATEIQDSKTMAGILAYNAKINQK